MDKKGILVVGSSNLDLVVTAQRFPNPGETVFGNKFEMFPGGKGANQAVCASRLGCKTTFVGKMGNDEFKEKLSQIMVESKVDISNLFVDDSEHTGTALITVDSNGQNQIIVISGSNMKLSPEDVESRASLFEEATVVLTQLEIPIETVLKVAQLAKNHRALFILNPAPAVQLPDQLLSLIDIITPNESELELITGIRITGHESIVKAAKTLIGRGAKNIIVTLGEKGSVLINNSCNKLFGVNKVKVVDSTAAGDAFNGALASSLADNHSIEESIEFANKIASITVTRMGAQSSMPYLNELKDLISV